MRGGNGEYIHVQCSKHRVFSEVPKTDRACCNEHLSNITSCKFGQFILNGSRLIGTLLVFLPKALVEREERKRGSSYLRSNVRKVGRSRFLKNCMISGPGK